MTTNVNNESCPRLPRGVKLMFDRARDRWCLLGPERIITCNATATEILKRIDGQRNVGGIISDLSLAFSADPEIIARDVHATLADLATKRLVIL
jgi:pyrroloquinoline quinone biosynthesis protein D